MNYPFCSAIDNLRHHQLTTLNQQSCLSRIQRVSIWVGDMKRQIQQNIIHTKWLPIGQYFGFVAENDTNSI